MKKIKILIAEDNDEIRKYLEKNHMLDEMALNMRNRKVVEFLLKEAKIA